MPEQITPLAAKLATLVPERARTLYQRHPSMQLLLDITIVLGIFLPLKRILTVNTALPESAYTHWSIAYGLLTHVPVALLFTAATMTVALVKFGGLLDPWRKLEWGSQLRVVVVLLGFSVAWPFVTYDYNYFFDQAHYLDRIIVIALLILTVARPVFVAPLVAMVMAIMWQFAQPQLGGSIFAHKLQVLFPLMLFAAAFTVYAIIGRFPQRAFAALFCCMVAASYWEAAKVKLGLGWVTNNELHLILSASYNHGWLATFSPATITSMVKALAPLDVILQMLVIALEAACLVILADRRFGVAILAGLIVFHMGVFALYGFLFWTWIVVDAALIWFMMRTKPDVFGPGRLAFCLPLVALGSFWAHTPSLGWLDTPVGYTYRIDALTADNQRLPLAPVYFAPYQDVFTMQGFSYLAHHPVLTGPYSVTHDADLAAKLRMVADRAALERLEAGGTSGYDPERASRFAAFVENFIRNKSADSDPLAWLRTLAPPDQFWSMRSRLHYNGSSAIHEVIVTEVTTVFRDTGPEEVRTVEVVRIPIEQPDSKNGLPRTPPVSESDVNERSFTTRADR